MRLLLAVGSLIHCACASFNADSLIICEKILLYEAQDNVGAQVKQSEVVVVGFLLSANSKE